MTFILIIFIGFICLVIISIKYDQIVPPTYRFFLNSYDRYVPSWFKNFNSKNKAISGFLLFPAFIMLYNVFWIISGNPKIEELSQIRSERIYDFHERTFIRKFSKSSYIDFRTEDGIYLEYHSAFPHYFNVKNLLQNDEGFTFFLKSKEDKEIFQILVKGHSVVSYEEICNYKLKRSWNNIIINIIFLTFGIYYLSKVIKQDQKEVISL